MILFGKYEFSIAQHSVNMVNVLYVFQKNGHGLVNIVTLVSVQGPYTKLEWQLFFKVFFSESEWS